MITNIVPVRFSSDTITIGRLPKVVGEEYRRLREQHWKTHAFRFDNRYEEVLNIALKPGVEVLGRRDVVDPQHYLLLIARAIQHDILLWLAPTQEILRADKRLLFWGQRDAAKLLTQAARKAGVADIEGLEVALRYEIDCRMFRDGDGMPYLGLVIDLATSNIIDIPVAELRRRGMQIVGRYVCQRQDTDHEGLRPGLELVGRVSEVRGHHLHLTDTEGVTELDANEAFLEPRLENLHDSVRLYYGANAERLLVALGGYRRPISTASGKLARIRQTLSRLKRREILLDDNFAVHFEELLDSNDERFPSRVSTERPTLLFGPQGRKRETIPDRGIRRHGPYMHMLHERSSPLIAVVCESQNRGRMEQFIRMLRDGVPDELWDSDRGFNPFVGGLLGKYRLANVRLTYEECRDGSAQAYREAVEHLLNRLPQAPDLAIVQIREEFKQLYGDANPYFVTKSAFMMAGVPTQAIRLANVDADVYSRAYILNNVALASYAKLDGIPWVMSIPGPTTHELVIGLGATEVRRGRLGQRSRYVGITTLFQGDGRYLVWGATREVQFEHYADALLDSLRATVNYVRQRNAWQEGDSVRLVCHVYKRLKDVEVEAIKALVRELVADQLSVEFAFLDISWWHPYQIFRPAEEGVRYWDRRLQRYQIKGKGSARRGVGLLLDRWRGLLQLVGPRELKTRDQGVARPLLVELHSDSDYTDLVYLLRQVYHFSYMSWRSFFPSSEPVTITYSRLIARLLGNLRSVRGWDSQAATVGSLRNRRWFL